jgi:ribose 1,5-bisphosphokinase
MTRRLIYVIGPSGAGKDSVLHGLHKTWVDWFPAHWARRTITRAAQPGGEMNECVSGETFDALRQSGAFAMDWQANGLCYGIRHTELSPLSIGHCVFVNGSRAYLPQVLKHWPHATVVQITAPSEVLLQRLRARNRESVQAISDRLARGVDVELPADAIRIVNDGPIAESVDMLFAALQVHLNADTACQR